MNNNIIAALILGVSILGAGVLYSQNDTIMSSGQTPFGTIQITGEGKAEGIPDTTILRLGAQVIQAENQEDAYAGMNKTINAIQEILSTAGIELENIETSNLSVSQDYIYNEGERVANGYNAYQTLTITIKQKEEIVTNSILDDVAKVPNIRIDGVSFEIGDPENLYSEARKDALINARMKADEIAEATGVKIIKVLSVTEGAQNSFPIPMYKASMDEFEDGAAGANIQAGSIDYTASLQVTYEIR